MLKRVMELSLREHEEWLKAQKLKEQQAQSGGNQVGPGGLNSDANQ